MQKTATVSHVLEGNSRTVCDFQRTVSANFGAAEICLEQGTHLSIAGAAVGENEEVEVEREHVDKDWDDN